MARGFLDDVKDVEKVLLEQIEAMNDEPEGGYSDEEFNRKVRKADATGKLVGQYVSLNRMKMDVVRFADDTGGLYNKTLGIEGKSK